ncbi:MAG: hypothetical protein KF905_00695 [Flavobacteriales bacterium]|nr:hypothetical protein [Flavobacteriales bacterium]
MQHALQRTKWFADISGIGRCSAEPQAGQGRGEGLGMAAKIAVDRYAPMKAS